jgi:tellurite resistance protein TehA-like permease
LFLVCCVEIGTWFTACSCWLLVTCCLCLKTFNAKVIIDINTNSEFCNVSSINIMLVSQSVYLPYHWFKFVYRIHSLTVLLHEFKHIHSNILQSECMCWKIVLPHTVLFHGYEDICLHGFCIWQVGVSVSGIHYFL